MWIRKDVIMDTEKASDGCAVIRYFTLGVSFGDRNDTGGILHNFSRRNDRG